MSVAFWYTILYQCTSTATGVTITAKTDAPVHLWCRISAFTPHIHHDPLMKRGILWRLMPRYCFTSYLDIEQEEAGDTYEHTFLITDWPVCDWRWFYFYGTVSGVTSPSTSPIFRCRRQSLPATYTFYPDKHPEVTSVDGRVQEFGDSKTWDWLVNAPGDSATDATASLFIQITANSPPNTWRYIWRSIALFDTSSLDPSSNIVGARLTIRLLNKFDADNMKPSLNVFTSNPASNTALIGTDYSTLGSVPLSADLAYDDIVLNTWHTFTLNEAGLAVLNPGGITKLGFRESKYDAPCLEPPWVKNETCKIEFCSAECSLAFKPKLEIDVGASPCP